MINKLMYKLTAGLPCRIIELDSGPYLERYYLGRVFGVTFYLHRFISSDSERHVHNHPWTWGRSLVLAGSYVEEVCGDICPHAPGGIVSERVTRRWYNRVDGHTFHRIHDAKPGTWTLFFHGQRAMVRCGMADRYKGWGFLERRPGGESVRFVPDFVDGLSVSSRARRLHEWWITAPPGRSAGRAPL